MAKHEYFENLCAAASIGQATGAELADLHGTLRSAAIAVKSIPIFFS